MDLAVKESAGRGKPRPAAFMNQDLQLMQLYLLLIGRCHNVLLRIRVWSCWQKKIAALFVQEKSSC